MNSLKQILVATDLSRQALQAAIRAALLACTSGARLHLIHAHAPGVAGQVRHLLGAATELEAALTRQTHDVLQTLVGELAAAHHVRVESTLAQGAVVDAISYQAQAMPADLIAIGARSTGFMRRLAFGSTAESLLRKSTCPVLVVKQRARAPYQRVLVALDFSAWSKPLIALTRHVAPHAHMVLLRACDVPYEGRMRLAGASDGAIQAYRERAHKSAKQQLDALARSVGLAPADWTPCLPHAEPALAIIEQEIAQACDLIVIGKRGRNVIEDLLLGSVTAQVLGESVGDVLVSTSTTGD